MLTLDQVESGYGSTRILDRFSLELRKGEMLAVLGRNGVGKSTMLRAVIGLIPVWSGSIRFGGEDVTLLPAHARSRKGIAYVPQGRDIFASLSVEDNLLVAAYGTGQKTPRAMLAEIYAEFPILAEKAADRGGSLSGGQQQILALARALMTSPDLLLLDEPSEGIQPSIVDQIAAAVRALNEQRGVTVMIVEQNLDFVAEIARRACIVDHGQIVHDLPMQDVAASKEFQKRHLGL